MFTVESDHKPLVGMMKETTKAPRGNGRLQRWLMELQSYNFTLKFKRGTANADADAMSRPPVCGVAEVLIATVEPRDWDASSGLFRWPDKP